MWLEQLRRSLGLTSRRPVALRAAKTRTTRSRLGMESLEAREVPAVINVISTLDNNDAVGTAGHAGTAADPFLASSLRSAISYANAHSGGNTINLTVAGDYKITLAGTANETDNLAGEFDIYNTGGDLTIQNTSGGAVAVDANHMNRVFDINPNLTTTGFLVTMQGFTIENGVASDLNNLDGITSSGGGVLVNGHASLTLNNVVVANNTANANGGGVDFGNTVDAPWVFSTTNTTFSNNHAGDAGGGLNADGSGTITIGAGSVFSNNTCVNQGAGIWLNGLQEGTTATFDTANLTVTSALFIGNSAQTQLGGGIGNSGNGAVTVTGSTFENNTAGTTGGAFSDMTGQTAGSSLTVTNSLFLNNYAFMNGGAIASGAPTTTITDTEIKGNSSGASGGGVFAYGTTLTLLSDTLADNTSTNSGGGILLETTGTGQAASSITNTTISGNGAVNTNDANSNGGGIDVGGSSLVLQNSTISGNYAFIGGGIFSDGATGSTFSIQSTIVAGNRVTDNGTDIDNLGTVPITDLGNNLIGVLPAVQNTSEGFPVATDQIGGLGNPVNPLLGALTNNGGPTVGTAGASMTLETQALLSGSTAIDAGSNPATLTTDARGFTRTVGQGTDIGAFEVQPALTLTPSSIPALQFGQGYSQTVTATGGTGTVTLTYTITGTLPPGVTVRLASPTSVTISGTPTGSGFATITVTASDQGNDRVSTSYTLAVTAPPVVHTASVSAAFGPNGEVLEVVGTDGVLTQYDSTGAHKLIGGVRDVSVAFGPRGEVFEVVGTDGVLTQYDSAGAHVLADNVLSANVAFGPNGEVIEVVGTNNVLTQYDSTGMHALLGGVVSVSVAYGPSGAVYTVVGTDGTLSRYDSTGVHVLANNALSASVAIDPNGHQVIDYITTGGLLIQIDGAGQHNLIQVF
ncbi:WD40 repeat domain-containing protein [Frigoriglobus tundricola]|uniref:Right handed beta helix domain-containing protein n=1 Tax=Frigoriglobus tundricola TaxID=2774151 RepID=A0A6M5Z6J5_9BACT|nr:WD40 repeat domain-containing protein [Frigoriglobus tundricola]QJX00853.1 hypothetical protein FTUN_8491 [Frigoriglobus tundricola]